MNWVREALNRSPFAARVAPFIIFVAFTALQGQFGVASQYWLYIVKTLVGALLIWAMWPLVTEMRWAFSWEAVAVGVFVTIFWIGLDPYYPPNTPAKNPWNPHTEFGLNSPLALSIIIFRILGSTLVVPCLEEAFFRSFLYRYIMKVDFLSIPLNHFNLRAFLIAAALFGAEHGNQWLAGILCAFCYHWLVFRKNRLGDAITAHAITNFLLGIYVAWRGQWQFW